MLERKIKYASGVPCSHPACWAHITHPCEVCGRIQCVGDVYESPFDVSEHCNYYANKFWAIFYSQE